MTTTTTNRRTPGSRRTKRGSTMLAAAVLALTVSAVPAVALAESPAAAQMVETGSFNAHEVEAALDRLRSDGMLTTEASAGTDATAKAAPWLAKLVGKKLLGVLASAGGHYALDQLLAELGFDTDADLSGALAELGASIKMLQADAAEIQRQIEALLHGQDRANFYNSYTQAGLAAADIDTAMRSVGDWIHHGLNPSAQNVSDMVTVINLSAGRLAFMAGNAVTGVVPLMMKAADASNVSDLAGYYADIDEVRDNYQVVHAQAIGALDLLVGFDHDGTVPVTRGRLAADAVDATRAMFAYGVEPAADPAMGDQAMVHARNSDRLLSAWADHLSGASSWSQEQGLERSWLQPILSAMAAGYNPAHHDGATLEQYLQARGIPTTFIYEDTVEQHIDRWQEFGQTNIRFVSYTMDATFGEIRGNDYRESTVVLYKDPKAYRETFSFPNTWTPHLEMKAAGDERYEKAFAENRDGWRTMSESWTSKHAAHGRLLTAPASNNVAGWAADFDPQRIDEAAFDHE